MLPKFLLLLMIAAGVGAWVQRDVPPVSGWLAQARALVGEAGDQAGAVLPGGTGSGAATVSGARPGATQSAAGGADAPGGLRKCVRGESVLYTAGACPSGSTEKAMANAQVSVVPAIWIALVMLLAALEKKSETPLPAGTALSKMMPSGRRVQRAAGVHWPLVSRFNTVKAR